ncbi:MAG: hypothetical protein HKN07_16125 [Acidimicrobiia bacterium]|nr:hypothetical protein [Acidimicrobiia bacterium]
MTFDRSRFTQSLTTAEMGRAVTHNEVVLTVDVAALQWARQRDAPHGAVLVADHEAVPRIRLGRPWTGGGHAAAFVVRPDLTVDQEGRLWLAAGLALSRHLGGEVIWPDMIVAGGAGWAVNVTTVLRPGAIDLAVMSFRTPVSKDRAMDLARIANELEVALDLADLIEEYSERCPLIGSEVEVKLVPRGEVVARVVGISESGALRLEMGSGRVGDLPVAEVRTLTTVS